MYKSVPSGPNAGIAYLTDMPDLDVEGSVHVNHQVLSPPSAFLDRQTGPPFCTGSQVTALIPLIEAHEGLGLEADSHSRAFRDTMWELGGPAMEGVVGADTAFFTELQQEFNEVMDAAQAASAATHESHKVTAPCDINYFPA